MRSFEKISFNEFKKQIKDDENLYNSYFLPIRKTKSSAGYDFELLDDLIINPQEKVIVSTGIKAKMNENEVLLIVIRSSLGFKYNLRLTNQIGVIDSDYYNNENNEGHIKFSLMNEGTEKIVLKKGDFITQGIFINYLLCDNDKGTKVKRIGGFGSTVDTKM